MTSNKHFAHGFKTYLLLLDSKIMTDLKNNNKTKQPNKTTLQKGKCAAFDSGRFADFKYMGISILSIS